jgi:hypothetical protein
LNNYREDFEREVTAFLINNEPNRPKRMSLISAMIDRYVTKYDETPPSAQLERLTNGILHEELADPNRMKVRDTEYPFLSERQFDRRYESEYSLDLAESYDTNGKNHAKPERRHRIAKEQRFIDKLVQQKNRGRNQQYKRDTSPGEVKTYNLQDTGGVLADDFVQCREINYHVVPEYYR